MMSKLDEVRDFTEQERALCRVALDRDPDLIVRAAEMIHEVTHRE